MLFLCVLLIPASTMGQFKYPHKYFDPREYQSDREVLCMDQSEDGTMYIGTGTSLVKFDGERWQESFIPGKKVIYWLKVDDISDRIYVGSSGEFGYFDFELTYFSLSAELDATTSDFGAIWEVDLSSHGVYFRSSKYIFRYHEGELSRIDGIGPEESPFDIIFTVNDTIFTRIRDVGLAKIYDGELEVIIDAEVFGHKSNAFIPHPEGMLIATRSQGLFLYKNRDVRVWEVEVNDYLRENRVYHATALSNGHFAFATLTGGVLIMDQQGKLSHLIKRDNYGIYEGTGYVFEDNRFGLWVGTKRGMAYIDISSPIRYYQLDQIAENTTFRYFDGKLYFGSVQGMYMFDEGKQAPVKVEGFPNLVSRIFQSDDLLIATNLGETFLIDGPEARKIFSPPVTSLVKAATDQYDYIGGHQEGLVFFKKDPDWKLVKKDEDAVKKVNVLIEYEGTVWGISSSSGLFRYDSGQARFYDLPGSSSLQVHKGSLVVTTPEGFYSYQASSDRFILFEEFGTRLPPEYLQIEDVYVEGDSTWVLYFNEEKILTGSVYRGDSLVRELPLFDARIEENIGIQLENGTLIISNGESIFQYQINVPTGLSKREIKASISSGQVLNSSPIPYSQNKLHFDFALKATYAIGDNYYRYRIDGYDDSWSSWNTQDYMEITNLLEGDYTLQLEVQTPDRSIMSASFEFSILPPWYRTLWAYLTYLIILSVLIGAFVKWRSRYLEDERNKLEDLVNTRTSEIIAQKLTIEKALKEREVLLREIHHRVKNNLQVISSIFNMQLKEAQTDEVKKLINDGQSRMKTMSLIHQKLYQSEKFDAIEFEDYTRGLIGQVNQLYNKENSKIEHVVEASNIHLDIDTAIPLGLILNELLSNSYKYAFGNQGGRISIKITKGKAGDYLLTYCDNGKGFPDDFNIEESDSLGLRLVSILARQLKGGLDYKKGDGASFHIKFKVVDI